MTRIVTRDLARWAAACALAAAVAGPQAAYAQQIRPGLQTQPQAQAGDQAQYPAGTQQQDQAQGQAQYPTGSVGQQGGTQTQYPGAGGPQTDATESPEAQSAASPASGVGGWSAEVDRTPEERARPPGVPAHLTPEEVDLVQRISAYLDDLKHLEGTFIQTAPNNKKSHGKFYVQRPGRLRFDYAPPSKMRIVADGDYLSIEDHDLNTVDQYPLESTPFELLLGKDVDLFREARILDVQIAEESAMVALEDKTGEAAGQLELYFKLPNIQLDEWVVTDPQGLDTRIQLADLVRGKEISKDFFRSTPLEFRKLGTR